MEQMIRDLSYANEQTAAYYLKLLSDIDSNRGTSYMALHNFFKDFYGTLYKEPEALGVESFPKVSFNSGEFHSKSKPFKRVKDKVIKPVSDCLDLIYKVASQGRLKDDTIISDKAVMDKFMKTGKRQKKKLLDAVADLGIKIDVDDDSVRLTTHKQPDMIAALHLFALKCSQNIHEAGELCFRMCDFGALDTQYKPSIEEILEKLYKDEAYNHMSMLHKMLQDNDFDIRYVYEPHVLHFEIRYTKKEIKTSPLMAFVFDFKAVNPLKIRLRFIATSRIVPIIQRQPKAIQKDFYETSGQCNGCGWCNNQKGLLKPSLLKMDTKHKTICWYDVNEYDTINKEIIDLIKGYVTMHLQLVG